jgi:AsnC-type helix-turn-helix domain
MRQNGKLGTPMDRLDRRILALYQNDTRRNASSIGVEVGLSAATMADFASFARKWFESDKSVARFDTHVVLDRVKAGLAFEVPVGKS